MFPSSHQVSLLHETRSAEKLVRVALTEHKFDIGTETEVRMKLVERNLLRTNVSLFALSVFYMNFVQ